MFKIFVTTLFTLVTFNAFADSFDEKARSELTKFSNNPTEYFYSGKKVQSDAQLDQVLSRKFSERQKIINMSRLNGPKSQPGSNDRAEDLLRGYALEKNIKNHAKQNLTEARLTVQPWSDDYWGIYKGVLGARYAEAAFTYIENWKEAYDYVAKVPATQVFASKNEKEIDTLSPSEKYDLLLSGSSHQLTSQMWAQGKKYYDRSGEIETWMGICHGWAPASYMVLRPTSAVTVMSFDGKTPITFYPADIKALTTLLWASTSFSTNFIGGRCRSQEPSTDRSGRITSEACRDTNPASFHISLVNGVGINDKSFVMDVTYSYEVWNQPVIGYKFKYFIPGGDQEPIDDLNKAIIAKEDYKEDPYRQYRASKTKYIVGVAIEVDYGVESMPEQRLLDDESMDNMSSAFYLYDLELDEDYNIIGGEWYHEDHPDFLWTPAYNAKALTSGDYYLLSREKWNGKSPLAEDIKKLGIKMGKGGSPLAYIVNSLLDLSRQGE